MQLLPWCCSGSRMRNLITSTWWRSWALQNAPFPKEMRAESHWKYWSLASEARPSPYNYYNCTFDFLELWIKNFPASCRDLKSYLGIYRIHDIILDLSCPTHLSHNRCPSQAFKALPWAASPRAFLSGGWWPSRTLKNVAWQWQPIGSARNMVRQKHILYLNIYIYQYLSSIYLEIWIYIYIYIFKILIVSVSR